MAESKYLDLAQTVMIERYDLDEQVYSLESFSEGTKAVSVKMSDGFIPVSVKFPVEFLEFERVKRMTVEEKRAQFMFMMPNWSKLSYEVRQLFSDVVDDWENIDEIPNLIHNGDSEVLTDEELPEDKPVKKSIRKVSGRKPVAKKKG